MIESKRDWRFPRNPHPRHCFNKWLYCRNCRNEVKQYPSDFEFIRRLELQERPGGVSIDWWRLKRTEYKIAVAHNSSMTEMLCLENMGTGLQRIGVCSTLMPEMPHREFGLRLCDLGRVNHCWWTVGRKMSFSLLTKSSWICDLWHQLKSDKNFTWNRLN